MFTFIPKAKRAQSGYRAMIIVRNPKGQCVGSKVSPRLYADADTAKAFARRAATVAAHAYSFGDDRAHVGRAAVAVS